MQTLQFSVITVHKQIAAVPALMLIEFGVTLTNGDSVSIYDEIEDLLNLFSICSIKNK